MAGSWVWPWVSRWGNVVHYETGKKCFHLCLLLCLSVSVFLSLAFTDLYCAHCAKSTRVRHMCTPTSCNPKAEFHISWQVVTVIS